MRLVLQFALCSSWLDSAWSIVLDWAVQLANRGLIVGVFPGVLLCGLFRGRVPDVFAISPFFPNIAQHPSSHSFAQPLLSILLSPRVAGYLAKRPGSTIVGSYVFGHGVRIGQPFGVKFNQTLR